MTNICFIPAKGNSRRLPRKNILTVGGKPLVVRAVESALESGCFDKIYVSSNDKEILEVAEKAGAVGLQRSQDLCKDDIRAKDVMQFQLSGLREKYNYVTLLMPSNPLRTARHIKEAWTLLIDKKALSLVSVTEFGMNPGVAVIIRNGKLAPFYGKELDWVREDEYPKGYYLNGAIYMANYDLFMEKATFLGNNTVPYIMDRVSSIDVDDPEDLRLAEFYLGNGE